jgi:hypothetical protein
MDEAFPEDFVPSRLGGTGFFPAAAALGETPEVDPGVEVFRCSGFTSWGDFGVGRFGDPTCGVGVGAVTCFFSSLGVAAL